MSDRGKGPATKKKHYTLKEAQFLGQQFLACDMAGQKDFEEIAAKVFEEYEKHQKIKNFSAGRGKGSIRNKLLRMIEDRDTENIPST